MVDLKYEHELRRLFVAHFCVRQNSKPVSLHVKNEGEGGSYGR